MAPQNTWVRAEEIFSQALQHPTAERETFVLQRCDGDADLFQEVLRLLSAQERMGRFLETGALDFRGQRFGAYEAVEEIGRGGMSIVYSGRRADGKFDQKAAIKVVLTSTGGAPETRILAALEHPNVASFLDAGVTELGLRFLVMEFVDGVPCTSYAAAKTERDKLQHFVHACHAVQAAHQSLVVHRDLKPDNILITSEGVVKVLDFGIAKMLAPDGAQTAGPAAWTADYASPEQILGQYASTANDVYSLGVILCEWIGGKLPRSFAGLALPEIVRRIQAAAPLDIPLDGDLGAIAAKALEYGPLRRYESAAALARDIERYLAGEAVEAKPPSAAYRFSKFAARHKVAVAATAAGIAVIAGTGAYAARQASIAEARFEQVRSLSNAVMFELQDAVQPLSGSQAARQMIVDRSLEYLDALPLGSVDNGVLLDAARGYLRVAEVQRDLGKNDAARVSARKASDIASRILNDDAKSADAKRVLNGARSF